MTLSKRHQIDLLVELNALTKAQAQAEVELRKADKVSASTLKAAVVTGVFGLVTALGGAGVTGAFADPAPVSCGAERSAAVQSYDQDDLWVAFPDDAPVEEQCSINTYMDEYIDEQED